MYTLGEVFINLNDTDNRLYNLDSYSTNSHSPLELYRRAKEDGSAPKD